MTDMKKEGGAILYNALIRTHHITSRKKVSKLKKEAHHEAHYVLIRSGGSPGLMYVEADEKGVEEWVDAVKALKYKDFHILRRPAPLSDSAQGLTQTDHEATEDGFDEEPSVKGFAAKLEKRGLLAWWQTAMGFGGDS